MIAQSGAGTESFPVAAAAAEDDCGGADITLERNFLQLTLSRIGNGCCNRIMATRGCSMAIFASSNYAVQLLRSLDLGEINFDTRRPASPSLPERSIRSRYQPDGIKLIRPSSSSSSSVLESLPCCCCTTTTTTTTTPPQTTLMAHISETIADRPLGCEISTTLENNLTHNGTLSSRDPHRRRWRRQNHRNSSFSLSELAMTRCAD